MAAHRRHKKHHHEEHENHERWLVSGFDMMTLMFAVFVVLFAISSTNVSKVHLLQQSLQEALSGPVFDGGRAMMQTGNTSTGEEKAAPKPPLPSLSPVQAVHAAVSDTSVEEATRKAAKEDESFRRLKQRVDKLVKDAGLADKVDTSITPDGLRIRLLTDNLLFDSGSAVINARALPA